ncbi:hypothetical protein SPRG_12531 [Saprolegnia parasitica CBS 223.65]|uniref:Uncharacterized protein n=1 Tax=Saprolegnia parasitica (strain CBS 223.65) TaxID=695850 RepID=A0A067C3U1_SAPPC|nr:hypothetical protein SPRG_12531 [Saprolegnia parasitica CBS 223.65]KDO21487.1 hypothetical protein SPRG_12531 [Saprolegnia parasitica CBS 223.65]|eukprot:XP_012207831.1 hypothetical protein SPRG_12531 [Saprolegnia parasitica CBS 223.65]
MSLGPLPSRSHDGSSKAVFLVAWCTLAVVRATSGVCSWGSKTALLYVQASCLADSTGETIVIPGQSTLLVRLKFWGRRDARDAPYFTHSDRLLDVFAFGIPYTTEVTQQKSFSVAQRPKLLELALYRDASHTESE